MENIHFKTISKFEEFGLEKISFREFTFGSYKLLGFYCKDHGVTKSNKCDCYITKLQRNEETYISGDWIYIKRLKIEDSKVEDLGDRKVRLSQTTFYLAGNVKTLELTVLDVNEFVDFNLNTFEMINSNLGYRLTGIIGYNVRNDLKALLGSIERGLPHYAKVVRALYAISSVGWNQNILGLKVTSDTPINSTNDFVIMPYSNGDNSVTLSSILRYFGETGVDQFIEDPMRFVALYSNYKSLCYDLPIIYLTPNPSNIKDLKIDDSFACKIDLMEHMIGQENAFLNYSRSEQALFVNLIKQLSLEDIQYVCKVMSISRFKILDIMSNYRDNMDLIKDTDEENGERKDYFIKFLRQFQGVYPTMSTAIALFKKWIENPNATPGQFTEKLTGDKLKYIGFDEQRVDLFVDALDKDPIWALSILEKSTKLKKTEVSEILEKMS